VNDKKETLKTSGSAKVTITNGKFGIFTDDTVPKLVAKFLVEILGKVVVHRIPETKPTVYVKLRACFEDKSFSDEITVPLSEVDRIKWADVDIRCLLPPGVAEARAQRFITNNIREKLPGVEPDVEYRLNRVGVHIIGSGAVFCGGGDVEVIQPQHPGGNSSVIKSEGIPYSLDFDPELTEEEAVAEMFELISLFPDVGRILLAYNLLYLMRELYVYAWAPPRFCLYVHGITDSRKTTVCTFVSQLYDRSKGIARPPRFDSSPASLVKILYSKSDCVLTIDDLCPSDNKDFERQQEKALSQIVRIIGDGVKPGRVNMKDLDQEMPPPEVGVVLTGEYLIGTGSDAARLLPIEVTPPDNETLQRLTEFQQNKPLVVSTVYRNFIQWFITNYDWAQEFLKEWWVAYGESGFTAFGTKVHGRLRETHYFLNTAYVMFLEYCTEKGFISEDEVEALRQSFLQLLTGLVQEQQVRVEQGKLSNKSTVKVDGLAFVREQFVGGKFKLAPYAKEFNVDVHDGVIHLNRLYLYGKNFCKILDAANISLDEVLDDLDNQGALVTGPKDRTVQLYVNAGEKRRCYAIFLTHLK